jgi:hypothetical protein
MLGKKTSKDTAIDPINKHKKGHHRANQAPGGHVTSAASKRFDNEQQFSSVAAIWLRSLIYSFAAILSKIHLQHVPDVVGSHCIAELIQGLSELRRESITRH